MFSPRSLFTRVLATFLPFCFALSFVACVSLCSPHGEELNEDTAVSAASVDSTHENEFCPISEVSSCTLPERRPTASAPREIAAAGEASFASSPNVSALYPPLRHASPSPVATDPPLERLGVLRI